ncbi:MAG: nucleotidyltransferase [Desulfuromonas sp. SDB]|nr:MAG: nucleotidyltransferase [Desulfuromonas sp. SDB]
MISRRYILEWKKYAFWPEDFQVEQDLILEKVLIDLFSNDYLQKSLAFRGGTALHKIYLKPQVRYSEDIDLVQVKSEPIKETLKIIRKTLDFLGRRPVIKQKKDNNTIIYRFMSEIPPQIKLRIKLEINCREHFSVLGYKDINYGIDNSWVGETGLVKTYYPEELLGTKIIALYQRKKGRDLFDLYYALKNLDLDYNKIIDCYGKYISFSVKNPPTKKQIIRNIEKKLSDPDFVGDIYALLRPGVEYNQEEAFYLVKEKLLDRMTS